MKQRDLEDAVKEDIRCHRENGVDLNPYSTPASRGSWQDGFEGRPFRIVDYDLPYRRGSLAAVLIKELT